MGLCGDYMKMHNVQLKMVEIIFFAGTLVCGLWARIDNSKDKSFRSIFMHEWIGIVKTINWIFRWKALLTVDDAVRSQNMGHTFGGWGEC